MIILITEKKASNQKHWHDFADITSFYERVLVWLKTSSNLVLDESDNKTRIYDMNTTEEITINFGSKDTLTEKDMKNFIDQSIDMLFPDSGYEVAAYGDLVQSIYQL